MTDIDKINKLYNIILGISRCLYQGSGVCWKREDVQSKWGEPRSSFDKWCPNCRGLAVAKILMGDQVIGVPDDASKI